jgi:hypothetical protein
MVVLKINAESPQEREVKILSDNGTWGSGSYHIYAARSLDDIQILESEDKDPSEHLGELLLDKEKNQWSFNQTSLEADEQKEIADFVMDYNAPDGVY